MSEENIKTKTEFYQDEEIGSWKISKKEKKKSNFKFNIYNCNQIVLLCFRKTEIDDKGKETTKKINLTDLQLLQWFYDFQNTKAMTKIINSEDGKTYCWINYQSVVDQFPLLELTKQTVYLSFKKMSDFGILEHYTHKMGGTFSCYKINEKIFDCIFYENNKTIQEVDKNILTLYKNLCTPTYNFINPLNKILLNKILYYYNNSTIKIYNINKLSETNCNDNKKEDIPLNNKKESLLKKEMKESIKNNIHPLTNKIIELFLKHNKNALKEENYKDDCIKYTSIYIKKYIKEYDNEEEFIKSFINSLNAIINKKITTINVCSHWFNAPYKCDIQSNYLKHRNKNFAVRKVAKDKHPELSKELSDILNIKEINNDIILFIKRLYENWENFVEKKHKGYERWDWEEGSFQTYFNDTNFTNAFFEWLKEKLDNGGKFEFFWFDTFWKSFLNYYCHEHDIKIKLSEQEKEDKLQEYLERIKNN